MNASNAALTDVGMVVVVVWDIAAAPVSRWLVGGVDASGRWEVRSNFSSVAGIHMACSICVVAVAGGTLGACR